VTVIDGDSFLWACDTCGSVYMSDTLSVQFDGPDWDITDLCCDCANEQILALIAKVEELSSDNRILRFVNKRLKCGYKVEIIAEQRGKK